ncbi:MAG TPA: DUF480 domain-containing protein, partial [Bryobacteraceae bacterium]
NALVNACNQKSSRDPVVAYDDSTVEDAVESLREKGFARVVTGAGSRVAKYGHRLSESLNLGRRELPLLCVLMLRGFQTLGELRGRTERMYEFSDTDEVERVLLSMDQLVTKLPHLPGTKEARYAHLMSGPVEVEAVSGSPIVNQPQRGDRIAALEEEVAELRREIEFIKQKLGDLLG